MELFVNISDYKSLYVFYSSSRIRIECTQIIWWDKTENKQSYSLKIHSFTEEVKCTQQLTITTHPYRSCESERKSLNFKFEHKICWSFECFHLSLQSNYNFHRWKSFENLFFRKKKTWETFKCCYLLRKL